MSAKQGQNNKYIVEVYKQTCDWARAYMNLRLRHFAAFSVILFFLTTALFKIDKLAHYSIYIIIIGFVITLLFWILDYRTAEFLKCHITYAEELENTLVGKRLSSPKPKFLKASMVTNLIFVIVLMIWLFLIVVYCKGTTCCSLKYLTEKTEINIMKEKTE